MTAPVRWLLFATHVPAGGAGGGMVRYAVELGRALARRDDVELHVLARPDARASLGAVFGIPDASVHALRGDLLEASIRQRIGRCGVDLDAFDVVHGTKHLVPRRTRGTTVLTVHDFLMLDRPGEYGLAKRLLLPGPHRASLRDAQVLVCVSEATRARLRELEPALDARTTTVPLALSSSLLAAVPEPCGALAGRSFALVVGDASPRKNLRFLTGIWPAVQQRLPDLQLAVAGPAGWGVDDGLTELDALVTRGAAARLGHLSDAELRWAYEHAAVVLCPSHLEGFGLPACEAVTFGAPVVSSPDPALAEASLGRARVVALDDPLGWVEAVAAAVAGGRAGPIRAPRRWDDVAAETLAAARAGGGR